MNTTVRFCFAAALFAALAGCGNKGPLMHPQSPADEMAVPATTTAPADSALPAPASTAPATPVEPTPASPADGGG
jgi:diaminopimelate decarboxylase